MSERNIYQASPNALAVAKAYAAERKAEQFADRCLLICIAAVCAAVISTTMGAVFWVQRNDAQERCK